MPSFEEAAGGFCHWPANWLDSLPQAVIRMIALARIKQHPCKRSVGFMFLPIILPTWDHRSPSIYPDPDVTVVRGEDVSANDGRLLYTERKADYKREWALYPRGNGSKCTWYVAAALLQASKGKIDLNSGVRGEGENKRVNFTNALGNGSEWTGRARAAVGEEDSVYKQYAPYISGVDRRPAVGSVFTKGNHVAWVESTEIVHDGEKEYWNIVVSEENYGGGHFPEAESIDVPGHPQVLRWRRSIEVGNDPNDSQAVSDDEIEFIHFNY